MTDNPLSPPLCAECGHAPVSATRRVCDTCLERFGEARLEHAALRHATALLLDDRRLEADVYERLAGAGPTAPAVLLYRSIALLVENLGGEQRAELADTLQARTGRLVARFGDHLGAGDGPRFDDAELDEALRRFLDDAGGAP